MLEVLVPGELQPDSPCIQSSCSPSVSSASCSTRLCAHTSHWDFCFPLCLRSTLTLGASCCVQEPGLGEPRDVCPAENGASLPEQRNQLCSLGLHGLWQGQLSQKAANPSSDGTKGSPPSRDLGRASVGPAQMLPQRSCGPATFKAEHSLLQQAAAHH